MANEKGWKRWKKFIIWYKQHRGLKAYNNSMFRKKEDYILNTFVIVRVLSLILLSLTRWTQQRGGKCTTLHQKKISELLDIKKKKKKNGARLQVTDVISPVCMSSLGWGGIFHRDCGRDRIWNQSCKKPSFTLALQHYSPYLYCLPRWRTEVTVNGNATPENEGNIYSLAEQVFAL